MSDNKARRVSLVHFVFDGDEPAIGIGDDPNGTHMIVDAEVWERVVSILEGVTHGCWDASEAAALVTEIGGGDE